MHLKEKWRAVVKDWKKSGLSQATYCRQSGINPTRLSYWKRKLSGEELILNENRAELRVENEFVEVGKLVNKSIEIKYGDLKINIPSSIESSKIAELINCLI